MIVISDTTPLISLIKINKLDLLQKLYGEIIVPEAVFSELTSNAKFVAENLLIKNSNFIRPIKVKNTQTVNVLKKNLWS